MKVWVLICLADDRGGPVVDVYGSEHDAGIALAAILEDGKFRLSDYEIEERELQGEGIKVLIETSGGVVNSVTANHEGIKVCICDHDDKDDWTDQDKQRIEEFEGDCEFSSVMV